MATHQKIKTVLLLALFAGIAYSVDTCIPDIRANRNGYAMSLSLQHIGTLFLVAPLLYDTIKNRMPLSAFVGLMVFAIIHVVGAKYLYYVPYKEWFSGLGAGADFFKDTRNHYDRFVHVSFGLFTFPCLLYISRKWIERKSMASILMAWLLIQAGSIIYEIIEWQLSVWFDKSVADGYNGQQGDMWDAQKDMALAMAGSTIMALFSAIKDNRSRHANGETK